MKKLIPLLFALFLFSACEKEPDFSKLSSDLLVYTDRDKDVNFATFGTYYIPDSILLITVSNEPKFWKDSRAIKVIETYEKNLNARGYTKAVDKETADLGIQLSYVESTNYYTSGSNNWWWDYPGYWGPGYWGNWGGWYHSYQVVYSYNVGSILGEMVNLEAPDGANKQLPIIWTSYLTGLLTSSKQFNTALTVKGIDQAFNQSPYIKK